MDAASKTVAEVCGVDVIAARRFLIETGAVVVVEREVAAKKARLEVGPRGCGVCCFWCGLQSHNTSFRMAARRVDLDAMAVRSAGTEMAYAAAALCALRVRRPVLVRAMIAYAATRFRGHVRH
eukprot:3089143-Rhodomonas_salina.1